MHALDATAIPAPLCLATRPRLQSVWNRMMRDDFDRVGDNAVDEIMGGRCLKFVHKTVSEGGGRM